MVGGEMRYSMQKRTVASEGTRPEELGQAPKRPLLSLALVGEETWVAGQSLCKPECLHRLFISYFSPLVSPLQCLE